MTQRYGLLGYPVKHSVSPQMQGAGFAALGIEARYDLIEVAPEHLAAKVAELRDAGYRGWNVTIPHKGGIIDCLDEVDPVARQVQSVNTVVNRAGRLHGYSTDGYGLEMAVRESFGLGVAGHHFVFWGTGGAARATSAHFAREGVRQLTLVNRTVEKAEELARLLKTMYPKLQVAVHTPDPAGGVARALTEADALIQCTSLGLHADDPISVPPELLRPSLPVLDMIYRRTALLDAAAGRGCPVADGRGMLLYQGVRSFEIWTEQPGPVEAMRRGLAAALAAR